MWLATKPSRTEATEKITMSTKKMICVIGGGLRYSSVSAARCSGRLLRRNHRQGTNAPGYSRLAISASTAMKLSQSSEPTATVKRRRSRFAVRSL